MSDRLTPRGGPVTTKFAHEFNLHEYPWPKLLGEDRFRWEATVKLVERAAMSQHQRECPGTAADGRTRLQPERFVGDHAEYHRFRIRLSLVDLLDAGIPRWLAE